MCRNNLVKYPEGFYGIRCSLCSIFLVKNAVPKEPKSNLQGPCNAHWGE
ncbi:hypothetical protein [uncultured Thiothrix sp.]